MFVVLLRGTEYPPQSWWYPPPVLMLCLQSTKHAPQYWMISFHSTYGTPVVLNNVKCTVVFPTVLNIFQCRSPIVLMIFPDSDEHPLQCWNNPDGTEQPPMFWWYPPKYTLQFTDSIPPHSMDEILHSTERLELNNPPQHWITSNILMVSPTVLNTHYLTPQKYCEDISQGGNWKQDKLQRITVIASVLSLFLSFTWLG